MKCKYCKEFLYPQCAEPSSHMEDEKVCEYFDDRQFNFGEWFKDNIFNTYCLIKESFYYENEFAIFESDFEDLTELVSGKTLLELAEKFEEFKNKDK